MEKIEPDDPPKANHPITGGFDAHDQQQETEAHLQDAKRKLVKAIKINHKINC